MSAIIISKSLIIDLVLIILLSSWGKNTFLPWQSLWRL